MAWFSFTKCRASVVKRFSRTILYAVKKLGTSTTRINNPYEMTLRREVPSFSSTTGKRKYLTAKKVARAMKIQLMKNRYNAPPA